ncbi:MAG TPA: DUF4465 domain-containing protein [Tepidisphaeraceae bacterium]|nr:DUF4465 domain-containing protein [Tepidisphaeraceae bacterium]
MLRVSHRLAAGLVVVSSSVVFAGPYTEPGIASSDPNIKGWATGVAQLTRGPIDIADPSGALASYGVGADALGPANGTLNVVSLGDGGSITLTFATPIVNGPGADFAVFENGFDTGGPFFAELAFVEVSSNGSDFFRFPSVSLTQTQTQIDTFGTIDPTDVYNLAGKHGVLEGTPFDLQELVGVSSLLNVNAVTHVRIIDVVGRITPTGAYTPSTDSLGNLINDPYPTPFDVGGVDLDAVAVLNIPEPSSIALLGAGLGALMMRKRGSILARSRKRRGSAAKTTAAITASALLVGISTSSATLIDFEDLTVPGAGYYNGGPITNTDGWTSGGAFFGNSYNSSFGGFWNGFAYSNVNAPTTPGFGNQYASRAGGGVGGSGVYAVAYSGSQTFINLPSGTTPVSVQVTNTAYAAFDMQSGSGFSKKFGGPSGDDPDFFRVIFTGYDAPGGAGNITGSATFTLADYTFADNSLDYIVTTWETLDLTSLGGAVSIRLSWQSSDVGQFGINTPVYAAIDNLTVIPEPSMLGLMALSLLTLRRRRQEV